MLSTKQISGDINGIKTQVVLQPFADRILVLVTQMGKVGNLVQVTMPHTAQLLSPLPPDPDYPDVLSLPQPSPSIQLMSLLGSAPSEHLRVLHGLYASQIATIIWTAEVAGTLDSNRRSVMVGLALRKSANEDEEQLTQEERECFRQVMKLVTDLVTQN